MASEIPEQGWTRDQVFDVLHEMRQGDVDYHNARTFSLVYPTTDEIDAFIREVTDLTLLENALNPFAFPSLKMMQRDVVRIAGNLLHGGDDVGGAMTSGGTESIFMAVKTARERARAERSLQTGNVVVPFSAHPAFHKACHLLGLEWRQLPQTDDLRADPDAMADALDDNSILAVGSAPTYPYGMVDDIPSMAAAAAERGVPFHVDACLGGYMLPWVERLGEQIIPWDFRVDGVSTISADLHKYGYSIKGASTVLHRTKATMQYQVYLFDQWAGGVYGTMGLQGTKAAAPIAVSWSLLHHLGAEGYLELMRMALDARKTITDGIAAIDGIHVWGEPDATVFAMGSHDHDIFAIGDVLNEQGWVFDRQEHPDSLHLMVSPRHTTVVDEFLTDLRYAVDHAAAHSDTVARYGDDVSEEAAGR
jgi:glutamate/tyrosine decarboxylase-like PLP-dependent enzyme